MYKFEDVPSGGKYPILVMTISNPYNPQIDVLESSTHVQKLYETRQDDLYFVVDMRVVNITFSDLVVGLSEAFKNPNSIYANPHIHIYTVGASELVRMGTEAATKQAQYGQVPIKIYESVDEAVTQAKADIQAKA